MGIRQCTPRGFDESVVHCRFAKRLPPVWNPRLYAWDEKLYIAEIGS